MLRHEIVVQDPEGEATLEVIAGADQFNQWMYQTIMPYCRGSLLEIGSGIGNISRFFVDDGFLITLSDLRPHYCNTLRSTFAKYPHVMGVHEIDLVHPFFEHKYKQLLNSYDTVFALNVIEHIADHKRALINAGKLLKAGGRLVILVPAYQFMFNRLDAELGHFRRYTRRSLKSCMEEAGFHVLKKHYFNAAGIPGWFFTGRILKERIIPDGQMRIFNKIVPAFRLLDKALQGQIGLSVIGVGEKPLH